jgi:hypothetical protein
MPLDAPDHLAVKLPADAYWHLIRTLRLTLPPPLGDDPEDLLRRDHAAIARIAALVPANAAEADLAAQFVAASEQWKDCLRLAQAPDITPEWAAKCRVQALGMMRQANSALRLLLRMQDARAKREADNAACTRAAWTEHCAAALMAEALSEHPTETAGDQPPPPPLGAAGNAEAGETIAAPVILGSPPAQAAPDPIAEAEHYAVIYPERAALIRALGRVPDDAFGPPDDDLVQALLSARTPALAALDRASAADRPAMVPRCDPMSRPSRNETMMRMPAPS